MSLFDISHYLSLLWLGCAKHAVSSEVLAELRELRLLDAHVKRVRFPDLAAGNRLVVVRCHIMGIPMDFRWV